MLPGSLRYGSNIFAVLLPRLPSTKPLSAADFHPIVAEARLGAEVRQRLPLAERPAQIDAQRQLAVAGQLLVDAEQGAARGGAAAVHVLHAGDAILAGLDQGRLDRLDNRDFRRGRQQFIDQAHRVVAQQAARLAGCRACDRSRRRADRPSWR